MSEPLEPLPPDIAELLEREKAGYPDDPALKSNVLERVERAISLSAPSPDAPKPDVDRAVEAVKRAMTTKLVAATVAAFVAGGAVGGAVVSAVKTPPPPASVVPSATPSVPTSPTTTPTTTAPAPSASATTTTSATTPPSASTAAVPSASAPATNGDLTKERELLDAARAALAQGHPDDAIAAVQKHETRWPHGYLAEEREVIHIQALVTAGRRDEAGRRAASFRKTYPKSMLMPAVDAALAPPATP